jgi:hypothetical protein
VRLKDLKPDGRNANKGTAKGQKAIVNSIHRSGAGRSIVVDRHGQIIGGNKTAEAAAEIFGVEAEVRVIETDGQTLIVHKRNDLDLSDPDPNNPARQLAYADNLTSWASFDLDPAAVMADIEAGFDFEQVDISLPDLGELLEGQLAEGLMSENWDSAFNKLPDEDRAPFQQMTFTLHDSQAEIVKNAIRAVHADFSDSLNENSNGNSLAYICGTFLNGNS